MRTTTRAIALAGAVVTASVAFAIPAAANEFEGQYTFDMGGEPTTWTVRPCDGGPTAPFNQCVRVAESGGENAPWEAQANWAVGYWTLRVQRPDAISCDDGSKMPSLVTYSWNAVTLEGQMGFNFAGGCGDAPAASLWAPFQLTPGPAPLPDEADAAPKTPQPRRPRPRPRRPHPWPPRRGPDCRPSARDRALGPQSAPMARRCRPLLSVNPHPSPRGPSSHYLP